MSHKFKVGDRLIKIRGWKGDSINVGEVVTVIPNPDGNKAFTVHRHQHIRDDWWTADPDKFELESVYNSPLFKALS
jgi:hypothetical protein